MVNSIASTVAGKAESVAVDLAFVLEGQGEEELPERVLGGVRLHHVNMKKSYTVGEWNRIVDE